MDPQGQPLQLVNEVSDVLPARVGDLVLEQLFFVDQLPVGDEEQVNDPADHLKPGVDDFLFLYPVAVQVGSSDGHAFLNVVVEVPPHALAGDVSTMRRSRAAAKAKQAKRSSAVSSGKSHMIS